MNEKLVVSVVIIASALPALGIGLAAITRRWMPKQFSKSSRSVQLQLILGIGMLAISISLIAFACVHSIFPDDALSLVTMVFVIAINIEAIVMAFFLYRESKKA